MNVVGDIAGQFTALTRLMDKMPKQKTIFVGDPNDRGWQSKEVIQYCIDNQDWITLLDSNHGDMFVDYIKRRSGLITLSEARYDSGVFEWNGGVATLSSYGYDVNKLDQDTLLADEILMSHIKFLESRPSHIFHTINDTVYLFTHAPLCPNIHRTFADFLRKGSLNDGDNGYTDFQNSYLWNRNEPSDFHRELPGTVSVFGHNSGKDLKLICEQYKDGIYIKGSDKLQELLDINKQQVYGICVDTSRDRKLCGLDLSKMEIYHENYPTEARMY